MSRVILFLMIFCVGCRTASKTAKARAIAENNKDVVVLSHLIYDYMSKTRRERFTLAEILSKDTLRRISNNFSQLELGDWGNFWEGGISVFYKFSDTRNSDSIKLSKNEYIPWFVKEKKEIGHNEAQLAKKFDGEIRFSYPERLYRLRKIVVKRTPSR